MTTEAGYRYGRSGLNNSMVGELRAAKARVAKLAAELAAVKGLRILAKGRVVCPKELWGIAATVAG